MNKMRVSELIERLEKLDKDKYILLQSTKEHSLPENIYSVSYDNISDMVYIIY